MNTFNRLETDQAYLQILLSMKRFNIKESEKLMRSEMSQYHKLAKRNCDTYESYSRFYSYHQFLYILAGLSIDESLLTKIKIGFNKSISQIFVIKGTIDLAHGNVFFNHLKNANQASKDNCALILIDYPQDFANKLGFKHKITCFGLEDCGKLLVERYLAIAALAIKLQKNNSSKTLKICWWGIAFGMAFTYALIKRSCKEIYTTFGTVKYSFEFSPLIVDSLLTATPWLIPGKETSNIAPSFRGGYYNRDELLTSHQSQIHFSKYKELNLLIKFLKANNFIICSGLSRKEKISSEHMLEIKNLLSSNAKAVYFLLCHKSSKIDISKIVNNLNQQDPCYRIISIPWLDPQSVPSLCECLDIFIDPTPFGAGMTACMAFASNIPILSCQDTFNTPSTMTSIHNYLSNQNQPVFNSNESNLFYHLICSKKPDLVKRFNAITNDKSLHDYTNQIQQKLLNEVFIRANINLIDNFANEFL